MISASPKNLESKKLVLIDKEMEMAIIWSIRTP